MTLHGVVWGVAVKHTDKFGHIILLKLLDNKGLFLPVYIGANLAADDVHVSFQIGVRLFANCFMPQVCRCWSPNALCL